MKVCPECGSFNLIEEFEGLFFCHDCSWRFGIKLPDFSKLSSAQQKLIDQLMRAKAKGPGGGNQVSSNNLDEDYRTVGYSPSTDFFPVDVWTIWVAMEDKEPYRLMQTIHSLIRKGILSDVDYNVDGTNPDWGAVNDEYGSWHYTKWIIAFRHEVENLRYDGDIGEWVWPGKEVTRFSWTDIGDEYVSRGDRKLCKEAIHDGRATRDNGLTEFIWKKDEPRSILVYLNGRGRAKSIIIKKDVIA